MPQKLPKQENKAAESACSEPRREGLQRVPSVSLREHLGAQVPEKQNWELQLRTVSLGRAAVAQSPF